MSKVAEQMRQEQRDRSSRMTPAERVAEALALGRAAIEIYASANGVSLEEARRRLELAGQAGRRRSRVMLELLA